MPKGKINLIWLVSHVLVFCPKSNATSTVNFDILPHIFIIKLLFQYLSDGPLKSGASAFVCIIPDIATPKMAACCSQGTPQSVLVTNRVVKSWHLTNHRD